MKLIADHKGCQVEIDSPFNNDLVAAQTLANSGSKLSDFSKGLMKLVLEEKGLSRNQRYWLHKVAMDVNLPKDGSCKELIRLFSRISCERNRSYPSATFEFERIGKIRFRYADKGVYAGCVLVTSAEAYWEDRQVYGFVDANGSWVPKRSRPEIDEVVRDFGKDPLGYADKYGQKTGRCALCGRALTAKDSVYRGIGPVCAKTWGGALATA